MSVAAGQSASSCIAQTSSAFSVSSAADSPNTVQADGRRRRISIAVHDVIVEQREVVRELHGDRRGHRRSQRRSDGRGAFERQGCPQELATLAVSRLAVRVPPTEVIARDPAQRLVQPRDSGLEARFDDALRLRKYWIATVGGAVGVARRHDASSKRRPSSPQAALTEPRIT